MGRASLHVLCVVLILATVGVWAQTPGTYDVFGAISYMPVPAGYLRPATAAAGWKAGLDTNAAHPFGAEIAASGFYGAHLPCQGCGEDVSVPASGAPDTTITFATEAYTLVAGPRWQWRRSPSAPAPFLHALFGVDHIVAGTLPGSGPRTTFASALGGGVDIPFARAWAFRVSADYFIIRTPVTVQIPSGNFRFSAGIVFCPGGR